MPRLLRPRIAGGIYHAYARGNRGTMIFLDDDDRAIFLALLGLIVVRFEWKVEAYCLMGNHFHLVLRTPTPNLSEGMQQLNGRYAQLFNAKYGYRGHLFDGRFKCRVIDDEAYLENVLTYVEHNPVRHGICRRALQWPWSSARRRAGIVGGGARVVDLVSLIALHSRSLDHASQRFGGIVRARWGTGRRRSRAP